MIVNRRTFTVKPGLVADTVELLKTGGSHMADLPTFRVYSASIGLGNRVVLELDFDDLAHYERWWNAWSAAPESAQVLERFHQLIEAGYTNEIWELH